MALNRVSVWHGVSGKGIELVCEYFGVCVWGLYRRIFFVKKNIARKGVSLV